MKGKGTKAKTRENSGAGGSRKEIGRRMGRRRVSLIFHNETCTEGDRCGAEGDGATGSGMGRMISPIYLYRQKKRAYFGARWSAASRSDRVL